MTSPEPTSPEPFTDQQWDFLAANHHAAMITVGKDGYPKAVRIAYAVVDGVITSSGTRDRVRTKRLLRDPRCTLYVHEPVFDFLSVETTVTVQDDEATLDDTIRYFRTLQGDEPGPVRFLGQEYPDEDELKAELVRQGRILYRFEPRSVFGRIR